MERPESKPLTVPGGKMGHPYCVVRECKNSWARLQMWKRSPGAKHNQPFILYCFPKSEKLQKMWLSRIGRSNLQVSDLTRVCSMHFLEGRPSGRSYFPTLHLQADAELVKGDSYSKAKSSQAQPVKGLNNLQTNGQDPPDVQLLSQTPANSVPLAQYNPAAQTLQIAEPAKYIMVCHTRIAQLTQENEKLKAKSHIDEQEIKRLQDNNRVLQQRLLTLTSNSRPPVSITTNTLGLNGHRVGTTRSGETQPQLRPHIVRGPHKFLKLPPRPKQ